MVKKLEGNTASLWFSAWSGLRIRLDDGGENVLVQYFRPQGEETIYEEPEELEIEFFVEDEDGELPESEPGFIWEGEEYLMRDFMRDNYMEEINKVLGGGGR